LDAATLSTPLCAPLRRITNPFYDDFGDTSPYLDYHYRPKYGLFEQPEDPQASYIHDWRLRLQRCGERARLTLWPYRSHCEAEHLGPGVAAWTDTSASGRDTAVFAYLIRRRQLVRWPAPRRGFMYSAAVTRRYVFVVKYDGSSPRL